MKNTNKVYVCLCNHSMILDNNIIGNGKSWFIWPNGINCVKPLQLDTICRKCLDLYGEDLTFPLIKAKLGVKNPFD